MTNTKTKFHKLKTLINDKGVGNTITRDELVFALEGMLKEEYTVDHYRRRLELGGYLSKEGTRVYKVEKVISEDLSLMQLNRDIAGKNFTGTVKLKEMFNY